MTSVSEIVKGARQHIRDFPTFFQVASTAKGVTYKMSHPNIDKTSLWVALGQQQGTPVTPLVLDTDYVVDERGGLIRLANIPSTTDTILIEGYYYEWFLDEDLAFFAKIVLNELNLGIDLNTENAAAAIVDLMAVGTVVEGLWSLLTEFSRDIDVHTPEGVSIPAHQRFQMTWTLWQEWESKYTAKSAQLNVGLGRIEVYKMRRVSYTYNRLVPQYRDKEIGDVSPPERLWQPIPSGVLETTENGMPLREYVDVAEVPMRRGGPWPAVWGGGF